MALLALVLLGFYLNVSHGADNQGSEIVISNATGVLGEGVYLHCLYTGQNNIIVSSWNRHVTASLTKKMAGYTFGGKPFSKDSFSAPASCTNLTVKVNISSLDMEGQYTCAFSTDDEEAKQIMFLTVFARPEINTYMEEEVLNGSQYQTISCSALNSKPMAFISWEIQGVPLREGIFSINTTNSRNPNGTFSTTSVLSFPVLLNSEKSVTCVVKHPALTQPSMTDVNLQTFASPNISMEMMLKQKEGKDFIEVLCSATGGRPHPNISWILPTSHAPLFLKHDVGPDSVASSQWFPSDLYEGENITCIFGYVLLPAVQNRTVTLPTYYISSLQLKTHKSDMSSDVLILKEGDTGVTITLEVMGNVPSYEINCTRDGNPVPEDVNVTGSDIIIKGPVSFNLSGQYHCQASYNRRTAILQLNIKVNPRVSLPATSPPNISVHLWKEPENVYIKCLASNAFPAANVSWTLPQDIDQGIQFNITSSNGLHTVQSILTLPVCLPKNASVECVVEHVGLKSQERRQIPLPTCVTNVTLLSSTVWEDGVAYTEVNCSADIVPGFSTITWDIEDCRSGINASEPSNVVTQSGTETAVGAQSAVRLPVQVYAGCTVSCVLEHQGQELLGRKGFKIPSKSPPAIHLTVGSLRDSALWVAVCEYRGFGLIPNISLIISDHYITTAPTHIQYTYKDAEVLVNATYEFQLSQHEGKDLTCITHNNYGEEERRTVHVPKYFISSIVVLNKTSPLNGNHGQRTAVNRVALQEGLPNQKIVFRCHGNISTFNIKCFRAGSAAHTVAMALVFAEPVSQQDAGLYTCHVTRYHHNATVFIQVDVNNQENFTLTFILICFSSAAAITLFLFITVCIFCKRNGECQSSKKDRKKRESLAGLMQTPCSPDFSKAVQSEGKGPDYAELVHFSIVFDVKSNV